MTVPDNLISDWVEADKMLAHWKQREMMLRKQIFDLAFPKPKIGSNKVRVNHGMALIGTYKINYGIDKPALLAARTGNMAPLIDAVIAFEPKVKEGEFKKLATDDRNLFGEIVTETPGAPSLELKPQGKVRW